MKVLLCILLTSVTAAVAELPPLVQLRDAAEKGDPKAQTALGDKYASALNFSEAERLYRMAALTGDPEILIRLAHFYIDGKPKFHGAAPVAQNVTNAIALYTLAANQGNLQSHYTLGLIHWKGKHVPQDRVKAYHHLRLSEKYTPSKMMLDRIILALPRNEIDQGELLAKNFKRSQFKDAFRAMIVQRLKLRGVTILPTYKGAWVNNFAIAEGKEFEIEVAGLPVKLLCEKVESNSVRLQAKHNSERFILPVQGR